MTHKTRIPFTIVWEFEDAEYSVECLMEPVIPGRISGPPENCYPSEGGEIEFVGCRDEKGNQCPAVLTKIQDSEDLYAAAIDASADADSDYADGWMD